MVLTITIIVVGCFMAYGVIEFLATLPAPRGTSRKRPAQAVRDATRQVDALFDQARIRMEEVAGRRRPGERRIGDGFGSWRRW